MSDERPELEELPPEESALYAKAWGPDAPKPRSTPTTLMHRTDYETGEKVRDRGARPRFDVMNTIPRPQWRALVLCANRPGRRPYRLALVTTWPEDVPGSVVTVDPDAPLTVLARDFTVECRCGMTHEVDGGRLRSAVAGLAQRRGKVPTVDVYEVERRSS